MNPMFFAGYCLKRARGLHFWKIYYVAFLGLFCLGLAYAKSPASPESQEYSKGIVATQVLCTSVSASGAPIVYPKTDSPEVKVLVVDIPPGAETGWHQHPLPAVAYVLKGSVTVELKDGKRYTAKAGEAFAEVVNTLHNGHNYGKEPVRIIMTVIGQKNVPVTVK